MNQEVSKILVHKIRKEIDKFDSSLPASFELAYKIAAMLENEYGDLTSQEK